MNTKINGHKNLEELITRTVQKVVSLITSGKINTQPEYQRKENVWNNRKTQAYLKSVIKGERTPVIDSQRYSSGDIDIQNGQQRCVTLRKFLKGKIKIEKPKPSTIKFKEDKDFYNKYGGKRFSQLTKETQRQLNNYDLGFQEEISDDVKDGEDYYRRVGTLTSNLNRAELNKTHFRHTALFKVASSLTRKHSKFYHNFGVLSEPQMNRMLDQLLTEELLILISNGAQASSKLNNYYQLWKNEVPNRNDTIEEFEEIIKYIQKVYPKGFGTTRFYTNTNNFYALVGAISAKIKNPSQKLKNPKTVNNNLTRFMASVFNGRTGKDAKDYWDTLQEGTKSKKNRKQRISILCKII